MSYSSVVLADNPYAYYPLQETSGTTAADSSGNGRDATYSGAVLLGQTGMRSGAASVASNGGYVSTPINPNGWAQITIEFLYQPNSSAPGSTLLSTGDTSHSEYGINISLDNSDDLNPGYYNSASDNGSIWTPPNGTLVSGDAYHLVYEYDSIAKMEYAYVNGQLAGSKSNSGNAIVSTRNAVLMALWWSGAAAAFKNGNYSDLAIYQGILSSTQIANHVNAMSAPASLIVNASANGGSSTNGSSFGAEITTLSSSGGSASGGSSSETVSGVVEVASNGGSSSGGQVSTTEQQEMSPTGGSSSSGDVTEESTQDIHVSGGSYSAGTAVANIGETTSGTVSGGSQSGGSSTGGGVTNRVQAQIQLQSSLDNQIVLQSSLDNQIYLQSGVMPMAALNQNFNLLQYSSDQITFTHAGDLTGCTLEWVMQLNRGSTTPTIKKTTSNGITITSTSSTQSTYVVTITNDDMAPVSPREYYHQVTLVDVLGESNPIAEGTVTVEAASNT